MDLRAANACICRRRPGSEARAGSFWCFWCFWWRDELEREGRAPENGRSLKRASEEEEEQQGATWSADCALRCESSSTLPSSSPASLVTEPSIPSGLIHARQNLYQLFLIYCPSILR